MAGMDRHTGAILAGLDHLNQSIADIIGTRVDTRFIRRWYGGELMDLIDAPIHSGTIADFTFAVADCLGRHEDRITLTGVTFAQNAEGQLLITPEGMLTATGRQVVLGAITIEGAR